MDAALWFEAVYNEQADFCFKLGRRFLPGWEDEDVLYDVVQEVFTTLWQKRDELMNHPNIGGWLALAVKYRMMGYASKKGRRERMHAYSMDDEAGSAQVPSPLLTPEQQTELWEKMSVLRELLGEENAELFMAYAIGGYKAKELGERFSISEQCVYVRISRMKKKLAAHPEAFYLLLISSLGGFPLL